MSTHERAKRVEQALEHADWWTRDARTTGGMMTTEAFRVLAAEVRRLRDEAEARDAGRV